MTMNGGDSTAARAVRRLFTGESEGSEESKGLKGSNEALRVVLCDGAMGTMLYARGVFINKCYDELNLSQPEMVRAVHAEYLQAGAEVVETNTFGANAFRLQRYGFRDKVHQINIAGVKLARECVVQIAEKQASQAFVAGSIGPLGVRLEPLGKIGLDEAQAAFAEQIRALVEGGPGVGADMLIVETMTSLTESQQAIRAAKLEAPGTPLIVMMTVDEEGNCLDGASAETAAARLTEWGADVVGMQLLGAGPATVLSVIERMRAVTTLPLAAMPNAGMPKAVDGRNIYMASPEYMASFARRFVKAGATFVGGCCGTTPSHTRAMKSCAAGDGCNGGGRAGDGARGFGVGSDFNGGEGRSAGVVASVEDWGDDCRGTVLSRWWRLCRRVGSTARRRLEGAAQMYKLGVDAINVPDSPRASARMSAQSLCVQIQQHVGIETILHYTCRDRNVLSIQSDLLGASSIGLKNVLCLTGDPPKLGNYPDATAVFDVDARLV